MEVNHVQCNVKYAMKITFVSIFAAFLTNYLFHSLCFNKTKMCYLIEKL